MTQSICVQPVILAGGSGTRLWPLSRGSYPKQLLELDGGQTMLQATARRLESLSGQTIKSVATPIVVAGEDIRFLVADQLNTGNPSPCPIILEPVGRNTAPAIAAAARFAITTASDPVLVVMPADHVVRDGAAFADAVALAAKVCAERPVIATFGIVPTRAETGFGYIHRGASLAGVEGAYALAGFEEKPDAARAQSLLDGGMHYWNGGIFVARASILWDAISRFAPGIASSVEAAIGVDSPDGDFIRLDAEAFAECPSDSIDYAVMEKLDASGTDGPSGIVVPLDAGWSDVGSWEALAEVLDTDHAGNVLRGDVVSIDCTNTIQVGTSRLVTSIGLDGIVVVETADAIFVAPRERSQEVKTLVAELMANGREEATAHQKVYRPWGNFESLDNGERYQVKRLTVQPGATLSLQLHHHRAEHWVVVRGTARVTRGEEVLLLTENESTYLPVGIKHRLENPGKVPLEVIEVQSGSYLGEDDIVRFEDVYKRT